MYADKKRKMKALLIHSEPYALPGEARKSHSIKIEWTCVVSVEAALTLLVDTAFDIVFIDQDTPGIEVFEGVRRVKESAPKTPLILLADQPNKNLILTAIQAGVQEVMQKSTLASKRLAFYVQTAIERQRLLNSSSVEGALPGAGAQPDSWPQQTDRQRRIEQELTRYSAILQAISHIAENVLGDKPWEECIQDVLGRLGWAAEVSRVYIFENHAAPDGAPVTSQRYEWVAADISPQIDNPTLQNLALDAGFFAPWAEELCQGHTVGSHVRRLPPHEQSDFLAQEIKSLVNVPIFANNEWWGFIGFDSCVEERDWSMRELEALKTAANILGAAIYRQRSDQAIRLSEEKYRSFVEKAMEGVWELDGEGRTVFVNTRMAQILGYKSPQEVIGRLYQEFFPQKDQHAALQSFERRKVGIAEVFDATLQMADGSLVQTMLSVMPYIDTSGSFKGMTAYVIDITQHNRALQEIADLKNFYENILEALMEGVWATNKEDAINYANQGFAKITGISVQKLRGMPIQNAFSSNATNYFLPYYIKAKQKLQPVFYDGVPVTTSDGRPTYQSGWLIPLIWNGQFEGMICTAEDITRRKQTEEALQAANERLHQMVAALEQRNRQVTLLNEMGDLLQSCLSVYEVYDVVAMFCRKLLPEFSGVLYILNLHKKVLDRVANWGSAPESESQFQQEGCWALRLRRLHAVANPRYDMTCLQASHKVTLPYICVPLIAQGEPLGVLHLLCDSNQSGGGATNEAAQQLAAMVAERVSLALSNLRLRETLQRQSIQDPLTGLFNRRYMESTMERELRRAARHNHPIGIMMMDIDHFKIFNDTHGHAAGDASLKVLADFLQSNIRGGDIACRYGGDEFILILPEASIQETLQRAEELRIGIKAQIVEFNNTILGSISVSMGITSFPNDGATMEALFLAADKALYRAKEGGRDRVVSAWEAPGE